MTLVQNCIALAKTVSRAMALAMFIVQVRPLADLNQPFPGFFPPRCFATTSILAPCLTEGLSSLQCANTAPLHMGVDGGDGQSVGTTRLTSWNKMRIAPTGTPTSALIRS